MGRKWWVQKQGTNTDVSAFRVIFLACFIAVGSPFLFGYGTLPLTNFAGEIVALVGFAMVAVLSIKYGAYGVSTPGLKVVLAAFVLLLLAVLAQYLYFGQINPMAWLLAALYLAVAAFVAWSGHACHAGLLRDVWIRAMSFSLLLAGVLASLAAIAQYLKFDGSWVLLSPAAQAGRTFGFIRQPNHQATFLTLGIAGIFALQGLVSLRTGKVILLLGSPLLVFGVVSTGSRTALIELCFLSAVAGIFLGKRRLLWRAFYPAALAVLAWCILFAVSLYANIDFYGANKLAQTTTEGVGVRSEVWRLTLDLVQARPWIGSGIFHYASAFLLDGAAEKAGIVMTHSHNLFLQIAYAFGVPVSVTFFLLIGCVLWKARLQVFSPGGFFCFAAIGCVLIHSQVEFPLWYTYFLLPVCYCLGWLSCGEESETDISPKKKSVYELSANGIAALLGTAAIAVAVWMNHDYYRVTPIFSAGLEADFPKRIEAAGDVWWFSQYVDYISLDRVVIDSSNYQLYLRKVSKLGCVMYEPWYQPNTILALTYANRIDEAKWILYSYLKLSGGKAERFKTALEKSGAARAFEVLQYLEQPVPVPRNTAAFDAACFGGRD